MRIESQKIALHHHAEYKQQHHAAGYAQVCRTLVVTELGQRERHRRSGHEHEQRHDQVPHAKALPRNVFKLTHDALEPRRIEFTCQRHEYGLKEYQKEEVESAQDIE